MKKSLALLLVAALLLGVFALIESQQTGRYGCTAAFRLSHRSVFLRRQIIQ